MSKEMEWNEKTRITKDNRYSEDEIITRTVIETGQQLDNNLFQSDLIGVMNSSGLLFAMACFTFICYKKLSNNRMIYSFKDKTPKVPVSVSPKDSVIRRR